MSEKRRQIYTEAVFQAMKSNLSVRKNLCKSVIGVIEAKFFTQKLVAFKSILCRSQINNHTNLNSKLHACSIFIEKIA